jgi:SAM-dependent methyltransferase
MTTANRPYEAPHLLDVMEAAERYNDHILALALAHAGPARSVLDFGAGTGRLAAGLAAHGFAVTCVEPDPGLRAQLVARGLEGDPSLEALGERRFDYAVSSNVLEHVPDDAAAVRALHARLAPGGRCFVYVPALRALWTANDDRVGHLRRYTRRGLARLFREAGFAVEGVRYVDSLGCLATLAYRVLGSREGELSLGSVRFYDRWIFPCSLALDRLGAGHVVGKNLALRARRADAPA